MKEKKQQLGIYILSIIVYHKFNFLFFGLLLSVVLIGTLASYFAKYIKENRWLGWVGIIIVFIVAMQLIIEGLHDPEARILQSLFGI